MKKLKKFAAALTSLSLAATMGACTPTIGAGTANAVEIDGYNVRAGVFIFYTLSAYYEAQQLIYEANGSTAAPTSEEVKESVIDNIDAEKWIQDKATEYCSNFVAVEKEFAKIGAEISQEDMDTVEENVETYSALELYVENGIGEQSVRDILMSEYKRQEIFEYYYGFEGEKGMSEEELQNYFDDNFARVKYVKMSLLDSDGEKLEESDIRDIEKLAEDYAKRVNSESDIMDKLFEMNEIQEDYEKYEEELTARLEAEALEEAGETTVATTTTTTTTTTNTETTTTTTTDPYENEQLLQKRTTATTADITISDDAVSTTTTTESASTKSLNNLNDYVFNEIELDKASVFSDKDNDAIYVVIRADLRDRMTEDDLWSEDYISSLQQLEFYDEFEDYMTGISESYTIDKNKRAYNRYAPFKLLLETESTY